MNHRLSGSFEEDDYIEFIANIVEINKVKYLMRDSMYS